MGKIIEMDETAITVFIPMNIKKRHGKTMIVLPNNTGNENYNKRYYDDKLIKAFAKAYQWQSWIKEGKFESLSDICKKEKISIKYANQLYRLNLIAPQIVESILDGEQPRTLCLRELLRTPIPALWCEQMEVFGCEEQSGNNSNQRAFNQCYAKGSTSTQLQEVSAC